MKKLKQRRAGHRTQANSLSNQIAIKLSKEETPTSLQETCQ